MRSRRMHSRSWRFLNARTHALLTEQVLTTTSACSGGAGRTQLLLEAEGVGLVHTAAEGDDGVFHGQLR
jgi:hypothetical protein